MKKAMEKEQKKKAILSRKRLFLSDKRRNEMSRKEKVRVQK